jgi:hypothetical protein
VLSCCLVAILFQLRQHFGERLLIGPLGKLLNYQESEAGYCRRLKESSQWRLNVKGFSQATYQLQRHQRITSEFEKVVRDSDGLNAQNLLPDIYNGLLDLIAWSNVKAGERRSGMSRAHHSRFLESL